MQTVVCSALFNLWIKDNTSQCTELEGEDQFGETGKLWSTKTLLGFLDAAVWISLGISCILLFRESLPFKIQPKSRWFGLVGLGQHCHKEIPALLSETSACAQEGTQIVCFQYSLSLILALI